MISARNVTFISGRAHTSFDLPFRDCELGLLNIVIQSLTLAFLFVLHFSQCRMDALLGPAAAELLRTRSRRLADRVENRPIVLFRSLFSHAHDSSKRYTQSISSPVLYEFLRCNKPG